jgi:hypothetical protein
VACLLHKVEHPQTNNQNNNNKQNQQQKPWKAEEKIAGVLSSMTNYCTVLWPCFLSCCPLNRNGKEKRKKTQKKPSLSVDAC